ncbi:MAG: UDP-N-acetylmuramoyl-L-alanine--D-glutamate ligase [bacterium]|nr:UDP-N-acetylmuramoyl-L-alanine--D-glutamate ligase [bacterium]
MKIAIIGSGREGKSVLKFLKKAPQYRKAEVVVLDQQDGPDYLKELNSFDLIFRSPGVPYNLPEIQAAIKSGKKVSSATKLFFELCPAKIIGVTGTKGKGTTSTLISEILKRSGKKVLLAGNIGLSPLEILPKVDAKTLVVLELSSFQLQDLDKSPDVAVITDIFPDHMDVHKDLEEYLAAKSNICNHQVNPGVVFYFSDNRPGAKIASLCLGKKIAVNAPNNLNKNRILAAAVAKHLGCQEKVIATTLENFRGLEHRLELVTKKGMVKFYNDSASTNPNTAAAAVSTLIAETPVILIAGGKDKNLDYAPLADELNNHRDRIESLVLYGENKAKISGSMREIRLPIEQVRDLKAAAEIAYKTAKEMDSPVAILLSPGAASFDMFTDYADRGEQFKKIVRKLK